MARLAARDGDEQAVEPPVGEHAQRGAHAQQLVVGVGRHHDHARATRHQIGSIDDPGGANRGEVLLPGAFVRPFAVDEGLRYKAHVPACARLAALPITARSCSA